MDEPKKPIRSMSIRYVHAASLVYAMSCIGAMFAINHCPPEQLPIVLPIALSIFSGGGLKLLNAYQNHATDKKVAEDLQTTKDVHEKVNGGMESRIQAAVTAALDARDKKAAANNSVDKPKETP